VFDDPTGAPESLHYAFDDEGVTAEPVALIENGVVRAPLLDKLTAFRTGQASNGHGRRVSFRHPAMPRMAHTRVAAGTSSHRDLVGDVSHGLLIQHLVPRHINLLSGDFSFFINEAQSIENGKLGRRTAPAILRGNAREALSRIVGVGNNERGLLSSRGCRKGNQGPLSVSFGIPTLVFSELSVEPQR
jgi:TldD protein